MRSLVVVGIFGALWGAVELSLGALLHALRVPFSGMFLAATGIAVALAGYRFVPKRGTILEIGLVTAALKAASLGGVVLSPMIGILAEAALAELVIDLTGGQRRWSFMLAGMAGTLWTLVHPFIVQGLLGGVGMATVWMWTVEKSARMLHLSPNALWAIAISLLALHSVVGALAGAAAWGLAGSVSQRLEARRVQA